MGSNRARTRSSAGMGLFACGMSIITAAALLNIAYDRLSGHGLEALPPFLAGMYDSFGKTSVTAVFVAAGLSVILVSFVILRNRGESQRTSAEVSPFQSRRKPYFSPPPVEEDPSQGVAPGGSVILSTRKYL